MIVTALKPGRLGNCLFLSAHFIGFARDYEIEVANLVLDEHARFFEGTRGDALCRYPPRRSAVPPSAAVRRAWYALANLGASALVRLDREQRLAAIVRVGWSQRSTMADTYDLANGEFRELAASRRLVLVKGWQFQHNAGLARHREAIGEVFTPIAAHREGVHRVLETARRDAEVLVGVHVRRADYWYQLGGRYFYDLDVYLDAMARVQDLHPERKVRYLICSDEQRPPSAFAPHSVTPGSGHAIEDLYALAGCDLIVGPPSTYSMWASFYSERPLYIMRRPNAPIAPADFEVCRSQFPFE